jgi:tetratricopeptide (TPR) repeat protein
VRKLIFQCLEHKANSSSCRRCKERAAFELAFCYYVGFGIGSDRQLAQHWAAESGNDLEDIEDEKDEVIDYLFQENPVVNALRARNFSMVMDHVNEYRKLDYDINMVQEILTREIRDLNQAFEGQFLLTATLQGILASIFLGLGRMEDAERLYRELVGFFERSPDHGSTHRDTLWSQRLLAETIRQQGRLEAAEELIRRVLINSEEVNGGNDPHVLQCKATLGAILFGAKRLEEATALFLDVREKSTRFLGPEHEQTLIAMSNLACAYRERSMLHKAEDLDLEVLEAKKRTLDDEFHTHFSTVTSAANLALTYYRQQRWDEAEKLEIWVVQERTKSLGALHPATLLAKRQLAETYRQQGRVEDAGVL